MITNSENTSTVNNIYNYENNLNLFFLYNLLA